VVGWNSRGRGDEGDGLGSRECEVHQALLRGAKELEPGREAR
jgi:hypothetical protein